LCATALVFNRQQGFYSYQNKNTRCHGNECKGKRVFILIKIRTQVVMVMNELQAKGATLILTFAYCPAVLRVIKIKSE
jgi:hypothetical protein